MQSLLQKSAHIDPERPIIFRHPTTGRICLPNLGKQHEKLDWKGHRDGPRYSPHGEDTGPLSSSRARGQTGPTVQTEQTDRDTGNSRSLGSASDGPVKIAEAIIRAARDASVDLRNVSRAFRYNATAKKILAILYSLKGSTSARDPSAVFTSLVRGKGSDDEKALAGAARLVEMNGGEVMGHMMANVVETVTAANPRRP